MPKSKRNKIVHLSQVKKKGKDHKGDLIKQLEENVAKFERVFIFDFDSVKSDRIMNLRVKLKEFGRIFAGRNSLATLTLKTIGSRTSTDFSELEKQIVGHRGLLFSDLEQDKLVQLLDKENQSEFLKRLIGYAKLTPEPVVRETKGAAKTGSPSTISGTADRRSGPQHSGVARDPASDRRHRTTSRLKQKKLLKGKRKATDEDSVDEVSADELAEDHNKRPVRFVKI